MLPEPPAGTVKVAAAEVLVSVWQKPTTGAAVPFTSVTVTTPDQHFVPFNPVVAAATVSPSFESASFGPTNVTVMAEDVGFVQRTSITSKWARARCA